MSIATAPTRTLATARISVGVYDEPELVVSGVRAMFAHQGDRAAVRPLADGRVHAVVDVLLCDPIDRDVQVEDYLARLASLTSAPIVALSWSARPHDVRRALRAGAAAYVPKSAGSSELMDVVEAVHRGASVPVPTSAADGLSAREADVLHLICRGLSNDEIAAALYVSVNSVKTYIRQVYAKLGVRRRAQAVAWGVPRGY